MAGIWCTGIGCLHPISEPCFESSLQFPLQDPAKALTWRQQVMVQVLRSQTPAVRPAWNSWLLPSFSSFAAEDIWGLNLDFLSFWIWSEVKILRIYLFIWNAATERKRNLPFAGFLPHGWQRPRTWDISYWFAKNISRKWIHKLGSWDSNWQSNLECCKSWLNQMQHDSSPN